MAPKPKPRFKPTIKQKINSAKSNLGKKIATGALLATLTGASGYAGYKVYKASQPVDLNNNISRAKSTNLSTITSIGERLSELNKQAGLTYKTLKTLRGRDVPKRLYYYDEVNDKIVSTKMTAKKANFILEEQKKNYGRLEKITTDKVIFLNNNSKPSEVYYWNGDKISKINLDIARTDNLKTALYDTEKTELDSISNEILRSHWNNDAFVTDVVKKMKILNKDSREKYMTTLSVGELLKLTNKQQLQRLNKVIKSLEIHSKEEKRDSREVLDFIQKETRVNSGISGAVTFGVTEALLLSLYFALRARYRRK